MKKSLILPLMAMTATVLLTGCFFAAPQDITYYDLNIPSDMSVPGMQLTFQDFENFSGAGIRMRYRVEGNQQIPDNLNKWANSPEEMIRLYLLSALTGSTAELKPGRELSIRGRLEIFDLNLTGREAILQFSYAIDGGDYKPPVEWQIVRAVVPLNEISPAEFARAFSEGANQTAKAIRNDILNHYQVRK